MKIIDYNERPDDEKEKLRELSQYEELLSTNKNMDNLNKIATEFTDKSLILTKIIEGNLLKESLRE